VEPLVACPGNSRLEYLNRIPKLVKFDETLPNFINRKHPRMKGREKETKSKGQSPGT
jgi:hypothetical protein